MRALWGDGKNLNKDIEALVNEGLRIEVKKALDVVRVIGNNAVHPGRIDLTDDQPLASKLFGLVNWIAENQISQIKELDAMYEDLPDGAREAIRARDGS